MVWSLINVWSEEDESNAYIIKFSTSTFLPHEYRVKAHWFVLMSSYTVNLNLSKCTCRKIMNGLLTLEKVLADINILHSAGPVHPKKIQVIANLDNDIKLWVHLSSRLVCFGSWASSSPDSISSFTMSTPPISSPFA